ncbi:MAG: hypothetical protein WCC25_12285 [Candidatus Korobacteraceae bacterium]
MKLRTLLFALALALPFAASSAQTIPDGTVLPVMLSPTLDARHSRPGQKITGRIKQDVPLPGGSSIPRNSTIVGQVVSATPAASGSPSRLAIKFDSISVKGHQIPITAHLRALASMSEVFEARMPTNALDDYGTSPSDWNTVQVGGAGVYRGSGQLIGNGQVMGRATDAGAVTAKLVAASNGGCSADGDREQALWIFSPWACGVYGVNDLKIAHTGRSDPVGIIEFESPRDVRIQGGSGWLLRVDSSAAQAVTTN